MIAGCALLAADWVELWELGLFTEGLGTFGRLRAAISRAESLDVSEDEGGDGEWGIGTFSGARVDLRPDASDDWASGPSTEGNMAALISNTSVNDTRV